ncbi:uncharacterized protein LOC126717063 isoform X1 [Quercus robur]|uniref:uncharacterized protein LOC126717063 isoform X1 n=1 Tax=Quercus robur TaxID=38942 RepID=UPI0021610F75|nr:uncharacterized protein LOC126717063 isoform X1 [Quercus robur]XP_050274196.1 uncharacterized protein LOC126717063 isoform X1 [Quercus robur]XP_050274197.1 uncharacterized protein LOC126717063 isoform X1 [Quercus robur]XP_050274198.1 uncharacterized protein LOC126717063 isoform X1 [Quercus robur]XP_050274199.1 uncharacterized protein LOC126717063 isoform X1 [Quercus robur]XP_050274200.1 uncharacterized protein LOC126717063 isoform X1 [Quercus robur]XP_050274201.1 uncharacterized protein LO
MEQQQQLLHFIHPKHPLVFNPEDRSGRSCWGCDEQVYGPSYSCKECGGIWVHHKSCAELPLGLHHPLHPIHPLILFSPLLWAYNGEDKQLYKCELCKEDREEYTYRCSRCDFNLHITCASLAPTTMEPEFHHHPLTPVWKWISFTCDLCGVEDKGMPYLCNPCGFWIHRRCPLFPHKVKVVHHKHLLHLTHSSLEFHQSNSRFCQICGQEVDTCYGFYYCSKCDFAAHLNCAIGNKESINLQEFKDEDEVLELSESVDSTYKVKKYNKREGGIQIAAEIKRFSHEHDLMLTEQLLNNQKCDGCVRAILPLFYSCVKCSFFLHESCANLPKKKRHPLHQHPLSLLPMKPSKDFRCYACHRRCNGFTYWCETCRFRLDVQCSMISEILIHPGHDHRLILSSVESSQNCSCCESRTYPIFCCTTCAFTLDFRCATLPHFTRYKQHEHPFALSYRVEDNSGKYYCDICEEERDSKYWFYYCEDCSYPAHPKCIIGKYPNYKFGGTYKFDCHSHPLTFLEETKDHPQCNECNDSCEKLIYQCAQCNFYIHKSCL